MKPLPKLVGIISAVAALIAPGGAMLDMIPAKYAAVVSGVGALLAALSHSLTGTGGKPVDQ